MNKLLIIGSHTIHTYNYIELIQDYFDDILLITDKKREGYDHLKCIELDFSISFQALKHTVQKIKVEIASFQPTVIHIHQANSYAFYGILANAKSKIPTVLTTWGSDILVNPKSSFVLKKMVQYCLKKADVITADAIFVGKEIEQLARIKSPVIIANFGIGIEPVDREKLNVIYSNRLHKKLYRVDLIIEAFSKFVANQPEWKLVIAATGDETEALKKQVEDLKLTDKVEFVGWIDKIQNEYWYSTSKIWVSIPESDATSISLLEAMACGSIPIVSDLPANKEWIKNGVNGIIATDLNSDFINEALEKIDFEAVITMNKARIDQDGTKIANKEKFLNIYKSLK